MRGIIKILFVIAMLVTSTCITVSIIGGSVKNIDAHLTPVKKNSLDTDGDGLKDKVDRDDDNDGWTDVLELLYATDPLDPNSYPLDTDHDGIPNIVDIDDDNDGFIDNLDAFSLDPKEWLDTDSDGIGNNADVDDDNDGFSDVLELLCLTDPLDQNNYPLDTDNDGTPNVIDTDDDNDGVPDNLDAFPLDPKEWLDTDSDGIGNNVDPDDDNDGWSDADELINSTNPLDPSSHPMGTNPSPLNNSDTGETPSGGSSSGGTSGGNSPPANPIQTNMIYDNLGNKWTPTGDNLVTAFNSLQKNGELWIPSGTFTVTKNLCITKDGIKIHGSGDSTIIKFSGGKKLISSRYASSSIDKERFSLGLNNIQIDNFKFTGDGSLEIVLGNNTLVQNVKAENIYCVTPGAFRFIIPNKVSKVSGLDVIGCSCYKVWWHGFVINSPYSGTYMIEDVLFENCASRYAGFEYVGRTTRGDTNGNWSVGFDFAENYQDSVLTIKDVLVKNCIAEYCWESGFHMENRPTKINVVFENCKSNYNGQKRNYIDTTGKEAYCSGFLSCASGVTMKNCEANHNTKYGFYVSSGTSLINCIGTGNWISLCTKGC